MMLHHETVLIQYGSGLAGMISLALTFSVWIVRFWWRRLKAAVTTTTTTAITKQEQP
jgi:hypothetical protein